MSNEKTPAFALQFRNRWEEKGGQEMGAIADMTESGNPAVFVRLLLLEDYGRARLEAQRALNCATWSFARSQGTGALVEVKHFAKTPRFLLSEGLVPDTAEAADGCIHSPTRATPTGREDHPRRRYLLLRVPQSDSSEVTISAPYQRQDREAQTPPGLALFTDHAELRDQRLQAAQNIEQPPRLREAAAPLYEITAARNARRSNAADLRIPPAEREGKC